MVIKQIVRKHFIRQVTGSTLFWSLVGHYMQHGRNQQSTEKEEGQ